MHSRRLRRALSAVALAALLGPLAACADDEDPVASPSRDEVTPSASASPSAPSFPVTIEQSVGDVTIPSEPSRVVALDFPSADAAIALGVIPVGMADVTYVEGGVQEWTEDALGSAQTPELFVTDNGFPFETIARLDPDVILATNAYPLVADSWSQLNAIAPVVAHVESAGLDDWQEGFDKVALALGKKAEGDRLVAEVEDAVDRVRDEHPEFEGKTASFFNYAPGDGLYVISTNDDVSMRFVRDLGFAGAPESVTDLDTGPGGGGRVNISAERYTVLEADVLLGTSVDPNGLADLEDSDLFSRVPAVARGAFLGFGIGPATALAFPSVLSIRWALDELIDDLADAVAAGAESASPSPSV